MKVSAGPTVLKYAEAFGISVNDVIDWINSYINNPNDHERLVELGLYESTENDRAQSIMAYVKWEAEWLESLAHGINERIRRATGSA